MHRAAQSADGRRHPFPRVQEVPKKPGLASRLAPDMRQGPAAAACCQRLRPAAAVCWGAAGSGSGQREGFFEPRNSTDIVLRKHEGCDEESARWRVQGALDQAGRRCHAAASECAGELAGRTCPGEAFSRPFDVLLAVQDEVDLTTVPAFVSDRTPSSRTAGPSAALLPSFTNKEKNKLFLFP